MGIEKADMGGEKMKVKEAVDLILERRRIYPQEEFEVSVGVVRNQLKIPHIQIKAWEIGIYTELNSRLVKNLKEKGQGKGMAKPLANPVSDISLGPINSPQDAFSRWQIKNDK